MIPSIVDDAAHTRPTPMDLVRRIMAHFAVAIACGLGGAVCVVVGIFVSLRGRRVTGMGLAAAGLLLFGLGRFLLRGGGLRWALRGIVHPSEYADDDDGRR